MTAGILVAPGAAAGLAHPATVSRRLGDSRPAARPITRHGAGGAISERVPLGDAMTSYLRGRRQRR